MSKNTRYFILFLTLITFVNVSDSFAQSEPPQFFTLDGRLFVADSTTEPLLDPSVDLTIQILDPARTCILYEETENVSTLATNGFFTARIGSVTSAPERAARDSNNSMKTVFVNSGVAITGQDQLGAPCSYTPVAGETRQFRFFITPSSVGTTAQLSEDMQVDSVPQALVAQTLQGLDPSNIFQTSATSTQAKLDNLLTTNYTALSDVISGTSSLYLQNDATGTQLPTRSSDPAGPTPGQIWFDTVANEIKYFNGSTVQSVGAAGAGISSLTAGAGLSGGTITTSGTIAIDALGVTNAMLASGINASKITTGTLPVGVVPTNTDTTKLPLAGGTMTGAMTMGAATTFTGFDLLNTGHITMNAQRTITIGRYDGTQQTTLVGSLNGTNAGATWFNTSTGKLMYWNGSAAFELSETTSSGGDITAITTNTGSGLTGGVLSGPATLAVNVDNTTIEVATNTIQIKDGGIAAAKLAADSVTTAKILDGEIVNADINAAAAIAWSKINKTGATAADVGAVGTARNINTVSGSGLTGGGDLSADRSLSMVVDNSTIEIAANTVQVRDGGITNAKINTVGVSKIVSGATEYFSYMPAGTECATGEVLKWDAVTNRWLCDTDATGTTDHGLLTGLADDDHTQYVLLTGRSGGQNIRGGTASGDDLTIESTSNATKGDVVLQPTGGNVGIGTTSPETVLDIVSPVASSVLMKVYNDLSLNGAGINFYRARGTPLAPTAVVQEDILFSLGAMGYDSAGFTGSKARILVGAEENWTPTATGTYIRFDTTDATTTTRTEKVRISSIGNVGIGTTNPNSLLTVAGVTALREVASAPTATADYGKIYAKTSDSKLYFMNDAGVEFDLTTVTSGGGVSGVASITGSGALPITAGGTNQNLTLSGSGTGLVQISSATRVTNSTASSSSTTGALTVSGGLGVAGDIYSGASVNALTSVITPLLTTPISTALNITTGAPTNANTSGNALTITSGAAGASVANGGAASFLTSPGGATGNGGNMSIATGSATGTGNGGNLTIATGNGTGGATGSGGTLTLRSGNALGVSGTGIGGPVNITAGNSSSLSTVGGLIALKAGTGGPTGAGGVITLTGGNGGTTSGDGGSVSLLGGVPVSGAGGGVTIAAANGVGTNQNGGNILLTPGAATGTGNAGVVSLSGNVGIGTALPTAKLQVDDGAGRSVRIIPALAAGDLINKPLIHLENTNNVADDWFLVNDADKFHIMNESINGNERLTVTAAGDVGIGTVSPASKLDVNGNSTVSGSSTSTGFIPTVGGFPSSGLGARTAEGLVIVGRTGSASDISLWRPGLASQIMSVPTGTNTVSFDGSVGVGTTAPTQKFDVSASGSFGTVASTVAATTTHFPALVGQRAGGTQAARLVPGVGEVLLQVMGKGWDGSTWAPGGGMNVIRDSNAAGATDMPAYLQFQTTPDGSDVPQERMRITSSGNVAIGTTTVLSNTRLDVSGQIRSPASTVTSNALSFATGNTISTNHDCSTPITFANIRDGGSYTVIVTSTNTTMCTFSTTTTGDDAATVAYRYQPANAVRMATSHSIYSLMRVGSVVYVSWITGFQ